ncbi:MAG: hypothetical protein DI571_14180 [Arsenicicoccus sp.]|nr:MAG: hypothetical protein DI571_14180 [Arsenicicoccus sp.]
MLDQPVIKLVLLVSVVVVTAMLTRSTAGVRHQAVRRLLLVGFVVLAAIAILFPRVMTQVAQLLGVLPPYAPARAAGHDPGPGARAARGRARHDRARHVRARRQRGRPDPAR